MGMVAAALFSRSKNFIAEDDVLRIRSLLNDLNLPTRFNYFAKDIINAAEKDKKKQGKDLYYVFLEHIGNACVEKIRYDEMNTFISSIFK